MATYKGTKGFTIQTIAGDPPAPIQGQVWYNTTSNVLKGYASVSGAWAAGGDRNMTVQGSVGAGSQTAAIASGGNQVPGVLTPNVEIYNGTGWTEVANLNTARYNDGDAGTTTAALVFGGTDNLPPGYLSITEAYNGTGWTEVGDLNTGRTHMVENIGIQTAALSVGAPGGSGINEEYNGTSWSELTDLTTGRNSTMGSGTSTAALVIGGAPTTAIVESWNGTAWTEVTDINTARSVGGSAMQASNTSSLIFGGTPPVTAKTESYNGTSWTEVGDLSEARSEMGGAGIGTAALSFGGIVAGTPTITNASQEWDSPVYAIKTVTVS